MTEEKPLISRLKFRGANLDAIRSRHHETVLCSPADTGKTTAMTFKHIVTAMRTPKYHGAIVRKTRASLEDSVVKTFDRIAAGLGIRKIGGTTTEKYLFKNDASITLIGMDRPEKLLSSEWDGIQVTQSEELREADWEIAASRVTGRGAVVKHPQIYGDCNPSHNKHWILQRKSLRLITGSVKDNPELYDDDGNLTSEGKRRTDLADKMYTGVRRQRLLYGIWATAEGAVYDMFQPEIHVKARPMAEMKYIHMGIDPGYTHPTAMLAVGEDSDGRLHVFREWVKTKQLQSAIVDEAERWSKEFGGVGIVCDEARPDLVADLRARGLRAIGAKGRTPDAPARNVIVGGIRAIQDRLKVQGDGLPRLTFDPSCTSMVGEMESYCWKKNPSGGLDKDEPEKVNDDCCDCLRYIVASRMTQLGFASAAGFVAGDTGIGLDLDLGADWLSFDDLT